MSDLAPTIEAFFTQRLISQRQASPRTVSSYRDTIRMLLAFAQARTGKEPSRLDVADIDVGLVSAFLTHLEQDRNNSARTRNTRLAAVHSLFRFAALRHPEHARSIQLVLAIPSKRHVQRDIDYLQPHEVDALLAAPDPNTWLGRRDHAVLVFMIQTGLRVSELCQLTCADLHLGSGAHITCHGKGRICRVPHMRPYVASGTMSRRRGESPPWGGDWAWWLDIFRVGQRLSRNASSGSGGR